MRASVAVVEPEAEAPSLSQQLLAALASTGQSAVPLQLSRGELVCLQDGRGRGVHVLSRGRVKVQRFSDEGRVILLDLVEPGDVFGELSFLTSERDGNRGPSYAEALVDAFVHSIPCATFERLLRARPALALGVASLLGERCTKLERRLEAHVFQKVPTRLAAVLLELSERYGTAFEDGRLLSIALSQQDLGNLIGASREIVSLTLSEFKKRGLVGSKGRRIVVYEGPLRAELHPSGG